MSKKKQETSHDEQLDASKASVKISQQGTAEEVFDDLAKKDSFSEAALWITVATLVLVLSTWTAWFPHVFPESTSAVGLVQSKDVEKLATKISTLEAKIPDVSGDIDQSQLQPFFQPLLRRMGENEMRHEALVAQVARLEEKLTEMSEKIRHSFSSDSKRSDSFWPSKERLKNDDDLLDHLKENQGKLEKAIQLNKSFRERTGRYMKAFALYESLETAMDSGEPYLKPLESLKNLVGASFEEEAFEILLSFAKLGIPSEDSLIAESQNVVTSQRILETPAKARVLPQSNTLERIIVQLKSLVKIRHKIELDSDDKSDFEHLEKAGQDLQKRDFKAALSSLEKIKDPSGQVTALTTHATAYFKSKRALLRVKKHLYSPIFLDEIWSQYSLQNEEKS